MFKLELHTCIDTLDRCQDDESPEGGGEPAGAVLDELSRQLRADPRGASLPEELGEALEMLLVSHHAITEAGEEMPSSADVEAVVQGQRVRLGHAVALVFRPIIARLRQGRDEADAGIEAARDWIRLLNARIQDANRRAEESWNDARRLAKGRDEAREIAEILAEQNRELASMLDRTRQERNEARRPGSGWEEAQRTGERLSAVHAILTAAGVPSEPNGGSEYAAQRADERVKALVGERDEARGKRDRAISALSGDWGTLHAMNEQLRTRVAALESTALHAVHTLTGATCSDAPGIGIGEAPPKPPPPPPAASPVDMPGVIAMLEACGYHKTIATLQAEVTGGNPSRQ